MSDVTQLYGTPEQGRAVEEMCRAIGEATIMTLLHLAYRIATDDLFNRRMFGIENDSAKARLRNIAAMATGEVIVS